MNSWRVFVIACCSLLLADAGAAEGGGETCTQIRAMIGVLPPADPDLLRMLAARKDCQFTSGEVYRAAYGDRPLPPPEPAHYRGRSHRDGDD